MSPETEKLVSLNLRYSYRESSLSIIVFADLCLKALYFRAVFAAKAVRQKPMPVDEITNNVATIINMPAVDEEIIKDALSVLDNDKRITGSNNKGWVISAATKKDIATQLSREDLNLRDVLSRHFSSDIAPKTIKKWFYEVSASIFSDYGDTLVANISKSPKTPVPISIKLNEAIDKVADKYMLQNKKGMLKIGYRDFLSSEAPDDQKLVMDLAIRWFSARLVAANIGADPLTLDELKGAKLILDTNVLIAIKLKRRLVQKSLEILGKALKEIDAELVYIRATRVEYENVITYNEEQLLIALEAYGLKKLKELAPEEDFVKAALAAGCKEKEDFQQFFLECRNLPEKLAEDLEIQLNEDDVIENKIEEAGKDGVLLNLIRATKQEVRASRIDKRTNKRVAQQEPLRENSIKHDAALIRVAEFLSTDEKRNVWVLSADGVLKRVGIKVAGGEIPKVMGLDTLIEFLALNSTGPGFKNVDFAPLLATIVKNQCLPFGGGHIRLSDLNRLRSTMQEAPNMPTESIKNLVRVITKHRIEGKPLEGPSVQIEIAKAFNRENDDIDTILKSAEKRTLEAEEVARQEKRTKEKVLAAAIKDRETVLKSNARSTLIKTSWPRLLVLLLITGAIFTSSRIFAKNITALEIIGYTFMIIGALKWLSFPWRTYRNKVINAKEQATKELKELR
jgi:predicted nucleic acid-binding protein